MNIHEYQAKQILSRYGINIPKGGIAYTPGEAKRVAQRVSPHGPWMMKAQIQSGARAEGRFLEKRAGKQGGIRFLTGRKDVFEEAQKMLGATLVTKQTGAKGKLVSKIYIEEYFPTEKTFYASLVIDRMIPCVTLLMTTSTTNMVDLAVNNPDKILRINLGLNDKINADQLSRIMSFLRLDENCRKNLKKFINGMHQAFMDLDAIMMEINPVGVGRHGELVALDAKISFDDNALFRHPDIVQLHDDYEDDDRTLKAAKYGFQYQEFDDGSIGCIVNGDGIALTIADMLHNRTEQMACFLNVKRWVHKHTI